MNKPYPGDINTGGGTGCIHGPINPPDGYPTEGSGGGWVDPGSQDIEGFGG